MATENGLRFILFRGEIPVLHIFHTGYTILSLMLLRKATTGAIMRKKNIN